MTKEDQFHVSEHATRNDLTNRSSEPLAVAMPSSQHLYEVRPRKDHRGVNLISDALPFGACGTASQMQSGTQSGTPRIAAAHMML